MFSIAVKVARIGAAILTLLVIVTAVLSLTRDPIPLVTSYALSLGLILLALLTIVIWRQADNPLTLIAALFVNLTIGRLFSTMHLTVPTGTVSIDPLLIAETGPGVASVTYATTALFIVLAAQLLAVMVKQVRDQGSASAADWGLAALRIYIGLMFIAHFAGHLFAGPMAFEVFSTYFASIGLPWPSAFVVLAGLIELALAIGLAFGLLTRLAALSACIYLFVSVGLGGHFSVGYIWVLPTGGWEFPALWIFAAAIFIFTGAGVASLDALLWPRHKPAKPAAARD